LIVHIISQVSIAATNVARYFAGQHLQAQTFVDVVPVYGPDQAKAVYQQLGYGTLK